MESNDERIRRLLKWIDDQAYIRPEKIPDIPLYMDQVTTFMEEHLETTKRYPTDKILTKTMINNYAKNNLLPPPLKKKYSKEHMMLLIFIYYFKNLLSFNDIQTFFSPITDGHFGGTDKIPGLEDIYREVFSLSDEEKRKLKNDIEDKYRRAGETFKDTPAGPDAEYLKLFSFVCELCFDVYMKKQLIEKLSDMLKEDKKTPQK